MGWRREGVFRRKQGVGWRREGVFRRKQGGGGGEGRECLEGNKGVEKGGSV